ncbi:MAG TPA: hypothetical protein PK530_11985, partial [Anaerolineales bacterium]|nr:hypothetical protein [Anaerolineales bacterium]
MIDTFQDHLRFPTAIARSQGARLTQNLWLFGLVGLSAALGAFMFLFGPSTSMIAWLLFILGIVEIIRQPRHGLYLILFLSLIGDGFLSYWYPFNKNFSSSESIMYLNGALIFSPLECYMVLTLMVVIIPGILQHKTNLYTSKLFWASISFIVFVIFGMAWGIARGGSLNIGLWEARPIFYLPVMLFLANNLLTRPEHISRLVWLAMLALFF